MPSIDHKDIIDISDLAELARECGEVLEDTEEYDAADREEAQGTLEALEVYCHEKGYGYADKGDADTVADALDSIAQDSDPLIDSDHFTDYMRGYTEEVDSEALEALPEYIRYAIDWDDVAESLRGDYSSYKIDGVNYYQR
jgi:hypothetical protein